MKKVFLLALVAFGMISNDEAQQVNADSLKQELNKAKEDTNKVSLYATLTDYYKWDYPDSALSYGIPGLLLAKELDFQEGTFNIYFSMGEAYSSKRNFPKALQAALKALPLAEKSGDLNKMRLATLGVGNIYFYSKDYPRALDYYKKLRLINLSINPKGTGAAGLLGETFFNLGQLDSGLYYLQISYKADIESGPPYWPPHFFYLGKTYATMGKYDTALRYFREGIAVSEANLDLIDGHIGIAEVFEKLNPDSAIHHAKQVLLLSQQTGIVAKLSEASELLARQFVSVNKPDSAFKYFKLGISARDSLLNIARQNLSFNEQLNQQELDYEQQKAKNRIRMNTFFGALGTFLLVLFFLWRNNRHKQKAKTKIEKAYSELKATQAQLIQSEKMASLGELTAGIAHEIQNPLNFVTNFSELNSELITEMKLEIDKGNIQGVKYIAADIEENEQKIIQHGKRADAIVKSMLQHSRTSSGQKEPTDINALADEYLRLSYHGLRAKDNNFNAEIKTDFDSSIGKINIIPQDIGRVMLNLINNAFYAVSEKKKQSGDGYESSISLSTKKLNAMVEIKVADNGSGIPQKILDKIFQPFFTTKPPGQGTGLGLSLAYDIVKAHGGEIKAETKEGEGTEFIIYLP
jgi:signal transduction histidine kinase